MVRPIILKVVTTLIKVIIEENQSLKLTIQIVQVVKQRAYAYLKRKVLGTQP